MLSGCWNASEGAVYIYFTLYYMTGHKNWIYVQWFGIILGTLSLLAIISLPETPKFLFDKKRFKEFSDVI